MKAERLADPKPFRRTLKPRPAQWSQAWFWMFGLGTLLMVTGEHFFLAGRDTLAEAILHGAIMATWNLVSCVYSEWKTQPRRLLYWVDDSPSGIAIRHLYTGEILFHTERGELQSDDLRGVSLAGADLRREKLLGSDLRGAHLRGANLEDATLHQSCFDGADLTGCRLAGTWLEGASFKGADLRGADFRGRGATRALARRMEGAHFFGARYNAATRWPPGFDPAEHGCAYENDAEQDLPLPSAPGAADVSALPRIAQVSTDELPAVQVAGGERRG